MENTSLDGAKNASCGAFWIANRFFYVNSDKRGYYFKRIEEFLSVPEQTLQRL